MPDSEDEDDSSKVEETCLATAFLRQYIEKGQIVNLRKIYQNHLCPSAVATAESLFVLCLSTCK